METELRTALILLQLLDLQCFSNESRFYKGKKMDLETPVHSDDECSQHAGPVPGTESFGTPLNPQTALELSIVMLCDR